MVKHPAIEVHGKESLVRVGSPTRYCKQIRAWYNRLHFEQTKSFVSTSTEVCNTVFSNRRVRWTCAFLVQAGMRLWLGVTRDGQPHPCCPAWPLRQGESQFAGSFFMIGDCLGIAIATPIAVGEPKKNIARNLLQIRMISDQNHFFPYQV